MKRRILKMIGIAAGIALSLSAFAACNPNSDIRVVHYDDSVVRAFRAVAPAEDLISQTATADGNAYRVTVITSSTVSEYRFDANFAAEAPTIIVGGAANVALTAAAEPLSDPERVYEKALELSGVSRTEVMGFDFDRTTYMDRAVFKAEIEDAAAEYTYIFDAADLTLLASKTELRAVSPQTGSSYLGEETAKTIALDAAYVEEKDAGGLTVRLQPENGTMLYTVRFTAAGFLYTVEIDAVNGKILKFSKCIADEEVSYPEIPHILTEEEAKAAALAFAFPEGGKEVRFGKFKLDYEDGIFVYEVEFTADGTEYEFEISAADGTLLDAEIEPAEEVPQGSYLTREEAIEAVRKVAGQDAFILEVDIERDTRGGKKVYYYEIEVRAGGREAEYFVDAVTGEVTLNEGYTGNPANPAPTLTEEDALKIALADFGLTEEGLTKRIKLEMEDGRLCYEIKLYADGVEYEMTIDAHSGAVYEREIDREHESEVPTGPDAANYITRERAIDAVKAYFADKGKTAEIKDVEWEDRGSGASKSYFYEVEAMVDGREYECYVDAVTAAVTVKGELMGSGKQVIGEERALAIALERYSLTKNEVRIEKVKLEEDDGILIYEVEFKVKDLEYSFEIDAETGEILEYDISFD